MKLDALDTPPERNPRTIAGMRAMTPAQRLEVLDGMVRSGRALLEAGIRMREPALSEAQVRWRLCERLYGEALTMRFLGPFPPC
jgi:hypothetical protein